MESRSQAQRGWRRWVGSGVALVVLAAVFQYFRPLASVSSIAAPLRLIGCLLCAIGFVRWLRAKGANPLWAFLMAFPPFWFLVPRDIRDEFQKQ
jgi:hypothetical protein